MIQIYLRYLFLTKSLLFKYLAFYNSTGMKNRVLIQNERISIVNMNLDMAEDVWQNSLDEDNRRFVPDEVFETLEDAKEVINWIIGNYEIKENALIYAVIRNEDNANLGYVQLVKIEEGWEIGYHIAKKYTGQGYATEAVNLFLDYVKQKGLTKEVYGVALSENKASLRVLEKCGFIKYFEGIAPYQGQPKSVVKTIKRL